MFGVEAIIAPPRSFGLTNHVEAVNWLWQDRTINRHHYRSLPELATDTASFVQWANTRRAVLDPDHCGSRYPPNTLTRSASSCDGHHQASAPTTSLLPPTPPRCRSPEDASPSPPCHRRPHHHHCQQPLADPNNPPHRSPGGCRHQCPVVRTPSPLGRLLRCEPRSR
jgi:hypothetical protein